MEKMTLTVEELFAPFITEDWAHAVLTVFDGDEV